MDINITSYKDALFFAEKSVIIIGLTGYTGVGCSTAKSLLVKDKLVLPGYDSISGDKLTDRDKLADRDKLVYEKLQTVWNSFPYRPFKSIEIAKVIFGFALLRSIEVEKDDEKFMYICNKARENCDGLTGLKYLYNESISNPEEAKALISSYEKSIDIYMKYKKSYNKKNLDQFITFLQDLGDQIRGYGKTWPESNDLTEPKYVFTLPNALKVLINAYEIVNNETRFVIDALRNPFEIVFFRQNFGNFYLVGIIRDYKKREESVRSLIDQDSFEILNKRENYFKTEKKQSKNNLSDWITSQDLKECLRKADMYIANIDSESKSYAYLTFSLIKLIALILRPGSIMPTHDERCMQLASSTKLSSGCISRQVGAIVVDKERRVLGVGWNDPPKGQIPCALRTCIKLTNNGNNIMFSKFEMSEKFREHIEGISSHDKPFCFRTEYSVYEQQLDKLKEPPKRAEYTRALHAEENALLQASRNSSESLEGATLYTTASTCTLCAKKAYHLGISRIVYLEEYYDKAIEQTIQIGKMIIAVERFTGIIGHSFEKLYTSPLPEKSIIHYFG